LKDVTRGRSSCAGWQKKQLKRRLSKSAGAGTATTPTSATPRSSTTTTAVSERNDCATESAGKRRGKDLRNVQSSGTGTSTTKTTSRFPTRCTTHIPPAASRIRKTFGRPTSSSRSRSPTTGTGATPVKSDGRRTPGRTGVLPEIWDWSKYPLVSCICKIVEVNVRNLFYIRE